ncbi:MAG: hypothetical protein LBD56_00845 [Endomicrobium sp.]|jgi:hypothetical protein|nr:hypothetical protein [Endomicrobium sp.]
MNSEVQYRRHKHRGIKSDTRKERTRRSSKNGNRIGGNNGKKEAEVEQAKIEIKKTKREIEDASKKQREVKNLEN